VIDGQQVRRPGHACGMVHAVPLKRFRASLMRRPPDDEGSVDVGVAGSTRSTSRVRSLPYFAALLEPWRRIDPQ